MKSPLSLGSTFRQGRITWRVGAVILTGGERYYMLIDVADTNSVALLPAFDVEAWINPLPEGM